MHSFPTNAVSGKKHRALVDTTLDGCPCTESKISCYGQQWLVDMLSDQAALGSSPSVTKKFSYKIIVDVADVNQRCCLEESGQWPENAN